MKQLHFAAGMLALGAGNLGVIASLSFGTVYWADIALRSFVGLEWRRNNAISTAAMLLGVLVISMLVKVTASVWLDSEAP